MSDSTPKKNFDYNLLRRVIALAYPYRLLLVLIAILMTVITPLGILRAWLIQQTIDTHVLHKDTSGLLQYTLIIVGILFVEALLSYTFTLSIAQLGQNVIRQLRVQVFNHILRLRLKYFDNTPIGTSVTRTINDVETINSVFSEGVITITADLFSIIAVLGIMFATSWQLALVCLIPFPFLLWATYNFKEKVKASFTVVRTQVANMNTFLQERISGMKVVQIFSAEEKEYRNFESINAAYRKANIDAIFHYALFFPIVEILSAAGVGLLVWWGAIGVVKGGFSLGMLIAFQQYLGMLFRPVRMLADKFNFLQMGLVASERVLNLLDNTAEKEDLQGTLRPKKIEGNILFKHIYFGYNPETDILKNVSFEIKEGDTLAIVGSTGSGKSTIINILNRFYPIKSGEITIGGTNILEIAPDVLRSRIGMVQQDVFLFAGSIYENITLRDNRISRKDVIHAAQLIGAHDLIEKLPNGYDYQVMERGVMLSMGQRQLISFIRVLVFNPDILILDEATSSIDPETETVIQHAIETLIAKRTSIIIAHRLSTIRHAQQILVLHKGEVMEIGSHEELLAKPDGHYRELYEMQLAQTNFA